jgi:hypothetical protein
MARRSWLASKSTAASAMRLTLRRAHGRAPGRLPERRGTTTPPDGTRSQQQDDARRADFLDGCTGHVRMAAVGAFEPD